MWNRRKEDEYPNKPAAPTSPQTASYEPPREPAPAPASAPAPSYEPPAARGSAAIGKSVMVKGNIYSREDLYIDGEVEGSVECTDHRCTVGPNGKVQANVKAREIVVLGTIHGNVDAADKIDIRKDARLVGDIKTVRIVIEDGAYFKGSIDIQKPEPPKAQPKKDAPQPVQAAQAAAQGGSTSSAPNPVGAPVEVKR